MQRQYTGTAGRIENAQIAVYLTYTWMAPGPSRSQIACSAAGSVQEAKPLDSSVNPIPALAACRLAHS